MNKLSKTIKAQLHEEMFELINNDITEEDEISERLSEILFEDYGFNDVDAIITASVYVNSHYVDIASEVELSQHEASEEYNEFRHNCYSSVMGVN